MFRCTIVLIMLLTGQSSFAAHAKTININSRFKCIITPDSIAGIKLGMRLNDVKQRVPLTLFKRTQDADGVSFVSAAIDGKSWAQFYVGDKDITEKIEFSETIQQAETFDSRCKTYQAVGPGTKLTMVKKYFGEIKEITLSEIESREYATFSQQKHYVLRVNYCGVFKKNSKQTKQFKPNCTLQSIAI